MTTTVELLRQKPAVVHSIGPDAPVLEAIKRMAEHGIGALLVMRGGELLGVVSERDYARKVILQGRSSSDTPVREIMSSPVITVRPDQTARACMQIMTERRVRHLPVMAGGQLLGVLSIGDLVREVLEEQQQTIEQLEHYIHS
ncbi:MAG TPA: CBS domain-containing protein [Steroidobacteraceae bacterium]|nr:CBS domain-containing protein [Steroidobacteraceae bacterium]